MKVKPKRVLDVTFLKVLLKDAEDYHKDFGMLLIQEKASENEQDFSEEEFEASSRPRYPKRNTQKKCYKEEDVSSEDEFLQCDRCELQYKGACPHHGPMIWVCDRKVPKNDPKRAVKTMPHFLSISNSAIPKAGLGVWTEIPLPQGFVFGPYKGRIVRKKQEAQKSGYAWQVWKGQKALHFVEGEDLSDSNWLRFVNCANQEDQQNVVAFQYKRQVFYKTYKPILPYTEILVWYGGEYASDMGIDIKEDKIIAPQSEIDGFKCGVCDHLFSSLSAMEKHEKTHPHMQPDRRHRCTECAYSTDLIQHLRRHLLTHSGERPHRCDHCDKRFTQKSHLKKHFRIHTGEKPFLCSTCGRGFNDKSNMLTHERTHSGKRPYRCQTCAKDFSWVKSLERHELTHTQQRPHRCPHCQHRSSRLCHLREHIVINHTRDYRHRCSICGKGFIAPSQLKKHAQKHHSTETK